MSVDKSQDKTSNHIKPTKYVHNFVRQDLKKIYKEKVKFFNYRNLSKGLTLNV
jgi:hypothetical protein